MKKNKYLILSTIILGFFVVNYVFAETEFLVPIPTNVSPINTLNIPTSANKGNIKMLKPNLIPSLVQQEIEKIKALKERTNQINTPNDQLDIMRERFINTNEIQSRETTTDRIKQDRDDQIKNRRVEQIKRYTQNVAERFRALIAREYQIKSRIQTRINKLEESGLGMSMANQLLIETDINFEAIKNQIESLRNEVATTIKSHDLETIENLFKKIKTETISLKKKIRGIHVKLVQTVKTMREKMAVGKPIDNNKENNENSEED